MAKEDLKPFNTLTEEEQKELARKGGIASGEARRARKTFKEAIKLMLETDTKDDDGIKKSIQDIGLEKIMQKFMEGDLQTFLAIRDTIGEKPVDKVEQETTNKIRIDLTDE